MATGIYIARNVEDVTIISIQNGEILRWDSAQESFVNSATVSGLAGRLTDPQNADTIQNRLVLDTDPENGQFLGWNSDNSDWEPMNLPVSVSNLYLKDEASDIATYEKLSTVPTTGTEDEDTVVVNSTTGEILIDAYATDAGVPGTTLIPAGLWEFITWAKVDTGSVGDSRIVIRVYKRTSGGVETELFNLQTNKLTSTVEESINNSIQPDFIISSTDRIVVKYFGKTTSIPDRTISFYYEGTSHYSHIHLPFSLGGGDVATDNIWDAKGDLAVGTGSNTATRVAVGTSGQVLTADSTQTTGVKWADITLFDEDEYKRRIWFAGE